MTTDRTLNQKRVLAGDVFMGSGYALPGGAGFRPYLRLVNPAGSGKRMDVLDVVLTATLDTNLYFRAIDLVKPFSDLGAQAPLNDLTAGAGVGFIELEVNATPAFYGSPYIASRFIKAGTPLVMSFRDFSPIINPDQALLVLAGTLDIGLTADYRWIEY